MGDWRMDRAPLHISRAYGIASNFDRGALVTVGEIMDLIDYEADEIKAVVAAMPGGKVVGDSISIS